MDHLRNRDLAAAVFVLLLAFLIALPLALLLALLLAPRDFAAASFIFAPIERLLHASYAPLLMTLLLAALLLALLLLR
jgi:hypothetical protein